MHHFHLRTQFHARNEKRRSVTTRVETRARTLHAQETDIACASPGCQRVRVMYNETHCAYGCIQECSACNAHAFLLSSGFVGANEFQILVLPLRKTKLLLNLVGKDEMHRVRKVGWKSSKGKKGCSGVKGEWLSV